MGFSLSASTAIIGVALLISLELAIGNVIPTITDVNDSYKDLKDRALEQLQTDIEITKVTVTAYGLNWNHTIYVNNTGSTVLKASECHLLINGIQQDFNSSSVYIYPDSQVQFTVDDLPGSGIKRYKIITKNGISDYFTYEI
jgi:archaellum component FlaF (FlaF/FlaG flagellin family)